MARIYVDPQSWSPSYLDPAAWVDPLVPKPANDALALGLATESAALNVRLTASDALDLLSLEQAVVLGATFTKAASDTALLGLTTEAAAVVGVGVSVSDAALLALSTEAAAVRAIVPTGDFLLVALSTEAAVVTDVSTDVVKSGSDTLIVGLATESAVAIDITPGTKVANDALLVGLTSESAALSASQTASDTLLVGLASESAVVLGATLIKSANDTLLLALTAENSLANDITGGGGTVVKTAGDALTVALSAEMADRRNISGFDELKVGSDTLSLLLTDTLVQLKRPLAASDSLGLLLNAENSTRTITEGGGEPEVAFFVNSDAIVGRVRASEAIFTGELE